MDRGGWWATVYKFTKSWTGLSDWSHTQFNDTINDFGAMHLREETRRDLMRFSFQLIQVILQTFWRRELLLSFQTQWSLVLNVVFFGVWQWLTRDRNNEIIVIGAYSMPVMGQTYTTHIYFVIFFYSHSNPESYHSPPLSGWPVFTNY